MLQSGRALNMGVAKNAGKLQPVSKTPVEADMREPNERNFAAQRRPLLPGKQSQHEWQHVAVNQVVNGGRALAGRTQVSEKREIGHKKQQCE